jgi:hypothetical protein
MRGKELAQGFQASQSAAVDRIETIQKELGFDCEFRRLDALLFLDPKSKPSVLGKYRGQNANVGFASANAEYTGLSMTQAGGAKRSSSGIKSMRRGSILSCIISRQRS